MNPWKSNTLEWTTPVEHFHGNWYGEIPTVHRWPYDYSKVDANGDFVYGDDFIPQTTPLGENEKDGGQH
jgi:cytochrome c oxidase subunit 1